MTVGGGGGGRRFVTVLGVHTAHERMQRLSIEPALNMSDSAVNGEVTTKDTTCVSPTKAQPRCPKQLIVRYFSYIYKD